MKLDLEKINKLKKSLDSQEFSSSYKNINLISYSLSIFGHFFSIFLSYFLLNKVLSDTIIENKSVSMISSIIILSSMELLKRELFDKFSIQQIKFSSILNKDVFPLFLSSILIIIISFYCSLNGASEFSSKSDMIENEMEYRIKNYRDSVNNLNKSQMDLILKKIDKIDSKIEEKDLEQYQINKNSESEKRLSRKDFLRIEDLKNQIEELSIDKKNYKSEIDSMKSRSNRDILLFENNSRMEGNDTKIKNSKNSYLFLVTSTIIEILILFGVYFNEYYKWRSYRDFRKKLETDDSFKTYYNASNLLNLLFTDSSKENDRIPNKESIRDLATANGINMTIREMDSIIKIFVSIKILKSSGSAKYLISSKENSKRILDSYFGQK